MDEFHPCQATGVVKPGPVGDAEIMALAGDRHVIVAVITHLAGRARVPRRDGAGDGRGIGLTFLTAKSAAHAPGFHPHRMHGPAKGLGHLVLDFARMLRRGVDHHVAPLLR